MRRKWIEEVRGGGERKEGHAVRNTHCESFYTLGNQQLYSKSMIHYQRERVKRGEIRTREGRGRMRLEVRLGFTPDGEGVEA